MFLGHKLERHKDHSKWPPADSMPQAPEARRKNSAVLSLLSEPARLQWLCQLKHGKAREW